jgi:LysM repeat protein
MCKNIKAFCALIILLATCINPWIGKAKSPSFVPYYSTASELIGAVNVLRAANGLAPYQENSFLMSIAQTQAEYLLSIGGAYTHTDANGRRPYERALAAGYMVAGNLNLGGFFSENITGGIGLTADEAVQQWMGDDAHKNTMLSGTLQDVGAGVAINDNTYYYVLDAGLSTGGTPVAYTPPAPISVSTPAMVPNTPNPDGSIVHIVRKGDTLGSISLAYNVPLQDLRKINNLTKDTIYVDQKIIVQTTFTPTPTEPTSTPTIPPTSTPWPSSTLTFTATPIPATPTPAPGLPVSSAGEAAGVITISALIFAGLIAILGRRKK